MCLLNCNEGSRNTKDNAGRQHKQQQGILMEKKLGSNPLHSHLEAWPVAVKELRHPAPSPFPEPQLMKWVNMYSIHWCIWPWSVTEERHVFSHCSRWTKGKQMRVTQDFSGLHTTEPFFWMIPRIHLGIRKRNTVLFTNQIKPSLNHMQNNFE